MLNRIRKFNLNYFKPSKAVSSKTTRVGREHFIPVQPADLIEVLGRDVRFSDDERADFRTFCKHLTTTFHHEAQLRLTRLRRLYAQVNPDSDTERLLEVNFEQRIEATAELFDEFARLVERANFRRLDREEIAAAIGEASALGIKLDVDLDSFERLAVFVRGSAIAYRTRREWKQWLRTIEHEIPIYQRLIVIFQSKDDDVTTPLRAAYIRLLKNVPQQDIDMALPGGRVKMSLLDRGKILLPTISGLGLVCIKIVKGALLLAFAGVYGLLALAGLIGGVIGSGMKGLNGYKRTKYKYELDLTRNLYYQNLDNNVGVLLRLAAEAESQELREAVLAYFVLWMNRHRRCDAQFVNVEAERKLKECGVDVDFETRDALDKLQRLGLCTHAANNAFQAVPLPSAVQNVITGNLQHTLG